MNELELKKYLIDRSNSKLTSFPISIKKILEKFTSNLPNNISFQARKYCFLNNINSIPKCKFSNNSCVFFRHTNSFSKYSKEYISIIKNDNKDMRNKWLSWESLFNAGLPLELAKERLKSKYYQKCRLALNFEISYKEDALQYLIDDKFEASYAKTLIDECDSTNYTSIDEFIEKMNLIKSFKNTQLEYYTYRGYAVVDAKKMINLFFCKGSETIKLKRKSSVDYDYVFCQSRKHGTLANSRNSKKEVNIINALIKKGYNINTKLRTIIDKYCEYKQTSNKNFFIHDIHLVDYNIIIEYNGVYWHKNVDDEIKKAYYCMSTHKCKYIIIWEDSFKSLNEIIDFIENNISSGVEFNSTHPEDIVNFSKYKHKCLKQHKWDLKFLEIAECMAQMSHCQSRKVCAIAVRDNRIIATGINGTIEGQLNCDEVFINGVNESNRAEHHEWSLKYELHAEANLISESAKNGIKLSGSTIYVTLQPCKQCTLYLTSLGVSRVVYLNSYDKGDKDFSYTILKQAGVLLSQSKPGN